jgi:UDP:flavonoid glycosyltransferase YjiC (YdhE family)
MQGKPPKDFIDLAKELNQCRKFKVVVNAPPDQRDKVVSELPQNITVISGEEDYYSALRNADVFVSNGGFGGVKAALTLGIPVVCFGDQDDKPDVCGRVKRSGAGLGLSRWVTPEKIVDAVERVLNVPSFKSRALAVSHELIEYEHSTRLTQAIERLLAIGMTRTEGQ